MYLLGPSGCTNGKYARDSVCAQYTQYYCSDTRTLTTCRLPAMSGDGLTVSVAVPACALPLDLNSSLPAASGIPIRPPAWPFSTNIGVVCWSCTPFSGVASTCSHGRDSHHKVPWSTGAVVVMHSPPVWAKPSVRLDTSNTGLADVYAASRRCSFMLCRQYHVLGVAEHHGRNAHTHAAPKSGSGSFGSAESTVLGTTSPLPSRTCVADGGRGQEQIYCIHGPEVSMEKLKCEHRHHAP